MFQSLRLPPPYDYDVNDMCPVFFLYVERFAKVKSTINKLFAS